MQNPPKTIIITAFNGRKLARLKPKNVLLACRPSTVVQHQNVVRTIQQQDQQYRPTSTCSSISSTTTLKRPFFQSSSRMSILPSPSPCPSSLRSYDDDDDDLSDVEFDLQPPRKRERLNHLTPEEKMYRRKMKNRIAAQSARDRKKMQMLDLEERIKRLEAENEALRHQNSKLSSVSSNLNDENSRLKCQLSEQVEIRQQFRNEEVVISTTSSSQPISDTSIDSTTTTSHDCCTEAVALESAAFINGLQQQGQATADVRQSLQETASSLQNKNHPLILFLAVIAAMNNYSIGCETFSSKNFKAIYVQQKHLYEKMDEQQLVAIIHQEIANLTISSNGKQLLTKKLEELLKCRKISKLKDV